MRLNTKVEGNTILALSGDGAWGKGPAGQSFALTREPIRQIEARALRKLRHSSCCHELKSFLEY